MGRGGEGLAKLDAMGATVEVEKPTARRAQMVAEWFAASKETKSVRTEAGSPVRAKTALMVAPTWADVALNTHAREQLRAAGQPAGDEHTFASLRANGWTKAQQKEARAYQPGDVLVAHIATERATLAASQSRRELAATMLPPP